MSPEQARGDLKRLGPRSDVYSLGATLYCVLTGMAPFAGDVGEALQAVQKGEFRRPRLLDQMIDRGLEAVCLKSMALEAGDRYATPKALSDDLERWMADEPVSAWHEPLLRRARRWGWRNRTVVAAAAVALLAGFAGLGAVTAVQAQANTSLRSANASIRRVNNELDAEKARVQERYKLAVEAIKIFHSGVSEDFLLKEPKFKELRERLLKSAGDFYGKLGALLKNGSDLASRRALGEANEQMARLMRDVGRPEDALRAYERLVRFREALAAEPGADAESKTDLGRSLTLLAELMTEVGSNDEALASYRKAETLLAGPAHSNAPESLRSEQVRIELAQCRLHMGWLLSRTGRREDALALLSRARSDQEALASNSPSARLLLANTIYTMAIVHNTGGKPTEALADYRAALAIAQQVAAESPTDIHCRELSARIHNSIGAALWYLGKLPEALAAYRESQVGFQKLVDENAAITDFQSYLAVANFNIAILLGQMNRLEESVGAYRSALAIWTEMAQAYPAVTRYRHYLVQGRQNLGEAFRTMGKDEESLAEHLAALPISQKLADDHPSVTEYRDSLATCHVAIGLLLSRTPKRSEAMAELLAARDISRKLADASPTHTESRKRLADAHGSIGNLLAETGKSSAAMAEHRTARAIYQKLVDEFPAVTRFREGLAGTRAAIGDLLSQAAKPLEAIAESRAAHEIYQKLAVESPAAIELQSGEAQTLRSIGRALLASGRPAEALEPLRQAQALDERLAAQAGSASSYRSDVAGIAIDLAGALLALEKAGEAAVSCDRGLALLEPATPDKHGNITHAATLLEGHLRCGQARRAVGDPAAAADDWRRAIAVLATISSPASPELALEAACHAALSSLGGEPRSGVTAQVARAEADTAVERLREAIAAGCRDRGFLLTETAFEPLRSRRDFRALLLDVNFPDQPFPTGP